MAYDSEHGKLWQDIKADLDKTRARASKFATDAEWAFGKRTARVLGVGMLFAVVVALLAVFLNWYVAPTKPGEKKDLVLAMAQILGGTALLLGLYFTWRTLQVNREGQITERFTRAIDQLGSRELEIRLGGIYALERIARDSERDHWTIMEVLTAYVRQHAPREAREGGGEIKTDGKVSEERAGEEIKLAEVPLTPGPDIKAIIAVLRRRTRYPKPGYPERRRNYRRHGEPEPLDLSATGLSGANFWHAYLRQDVLTGADLRQANLSGADLSGAFVSEANLSEAKLSGANLTEADLSGADLSGADLSWANLSWANLSSGANLSGADLRLANLRSANLSEADLSHADLSGANLQKAGLGGARLQVAHGVTQEQLEQAFGNEHTQVPLLLKPPAHWNVKIDEQPEEH